MTEFDHEHFMQAVGNADEINELLRRYGVKFGIYKNGVFNEQFFPFDPIPRVISAQDFSGIEKGLVQRVNALNEFLFDIYHDKNIVRDGIIPEDFIYISKGYLAECEGITPKNKVYSHISGIDLVQAKVGEWYILEDNLRIPSGASYPLIARELTRIAAPQAFSENHIVDNRGYAELLKETMEYSNCGGIRAILTPGRYNAAYFEHSYLAEHTGSVLVQNDELFVEDNILYQRTYSGSKTRIGVLYRRIADEYLDPLTFLPESLIGIPNLMEAYRSGNVGIVNAPGNGVADDKGMSDRPMIAWIFDSEEYTARYYELLSEFLGSVDFGTIVSETAEMIDKYVEKDPTKFCTYDEFKKGVVAIKGFCELRAESIKGQLDGSIPSTSEGQSADSLAVSAEKAADRAVRLRKAPTAQTRERITIIRKNQRVTVPKNRTALRTGKKRPSGSGFPSMNGSPQTNDETTYILLGVSVLVLIAGVIFAAKFKR